jgi:signal transduction histidine kinase
MSSVNLLLSLINDIIDYQKFEQDEFVPYEVTFKLSSLLKEIHDIFKIQAWGKGLNFEINTHYMDEITDLTINSDWQRLSQILINIVSNSIKYTYEGFVKVDIRYSVQGRVEF